MPEKPVIIVEESGRGCLGKAMAMLGSLISAVWLMNLSFGIIEIPDNLPVVGNIDETAAAWVLFSCLSYLGINIVPFRNTIIRPSLPKLEKKD